MMPPAPPDDDTHWLGMGKQTAASKWRWGVSERAYKAAMEIYLSIHLVVSSYLFYIYIYLEFSDFFLKKMYVHICIRLKYILPVSTEAMHMVEFMIKK